MKHILAVVLGVLFVIPSNAGILFEPYVGYELGSFSWKSKPVLGITVEEKGTANGVGAGARLAYMLPALLFLGVDVHSSSVKVTGTSVTPSSQTKSNADASRLGVYALVGAEFLMGLRVYAGYAVHNAMESKLGSGGKAKYSGGTNMKLGLGYRIIPKFALNVEYITRTYDSVESGGTSEPLSNTLEYFNDNTIMLSASIPL